MIPQVFTIQLTEPLEAELYSKWQTLLDERKYAAINRLRLQKDRERSITANMLARYAIHQVFGLPMQSISFAVTQSGKPYVDGMDHVFFNISHSGDWCVCAVSDCEIGVDVQKMDHLDFLTIAQRFFLPHEIEELEHLNEAERCAHFYKLWCKKESYLKRQGLGVSAIAEETNYSTCNFWYYNDLPEHSLCVCW